ncbi:MAG TPA: ferritin-like domain-containing protein [Xanthobacteraceae bacterium]|nr:ferritin-like domain-containing protein [Xanthobacteraceae bacterium]
MKTMEDLFYGLLQDVYFAEKQLLKTLPKLSKKAADGQLAEAFREHAGQTEEHVARLEKAFEMIGKKPRAKKCEAILGIVAEGEDVIKEADEDDVRDAGLIGAAQAAEHYEIARYGTLCAWAKQIGKPQLARLLHETLQEERQTDEKLTKIAESSVNQAAMSA